MKVIFYPEPRKIYQWVPHTMFALVPTGTQKIGFGVDLCFLEEISVISCTRENLTCENILEQFW